ncbi:MAG: hypothetical protein Kapaf2KO_00310 [Candidatus Kapaibacteriales bacterium]
MKIFVVIVSLFVAGIAFSQQLAPCDTVISFTPGEGTGFGQAEIYFPENILGWPSSTARKNVAESSPEEICSLGLGGEIVLGWKSGYLVDAPGDDFTVYENAFEYFKGIYSEPAVVSISKDGETWITYEFDELKLEGLAGTEPTIGDGDVGAPGGAGGNSFDIAALGLDTIRYIKLTDTTNIILQNPDHPNYDFTLNGFDLDAIVGYSVERHINSVADYYDECIGCEIEYFNVKGQRVEEYDEYNLVSLQPYFERIKNNKIIRILYN